MEELSKLELHAYLARALKKLDRPPQWQDWEKAAIAWGICFDGYIDVKGHEVGLGVYDPALIDAWFKLVRIGGRGAYVRGGDKLKWRVAAYREVLYFLVQIYPFLPTKREKAKAVIEHCARRVEEEDRVVI